MPHRSQKRLIRLLTTILLLIIVGYLAGRTSLTTDQTSTRNNVPASDAPAGNAALITEPSAGVAPVLAQINGSKTSVDMVMYELQDTRVEQALADAQARGVSVRVLLNSGYYGRPDSSNPNQAAYNYLQTHRIPVHWTPGYFALTHQKTLVIDGRSALIMTFNLTPKYYATSRDFGITDNDRVDVSAIETAFAADWQNQKITAPSGDDLLWSPGSEAATVNLINGAKTSVKVYNEEMADSKIVDALGSAAMRGVNVEVVMTDQSSWHANFSKLTTDGVKVHTFAANAPLYIHAKMVLVDGTQAFVGSENFSTTSLDRNRELGITSSDKSILAGLASTFTSDYANATAY